MSKKDGPLPLILILNFLISFSASPPKFMTMEDLIKATTGVKNMALAHEIAVDTNFKIEPTEKNPNR